MKTIKSGENTGTGPLGLEKGKMTAQCLLFTGYKVSTKLCDI